MSLNAAIVCFSGFTERSATHGNGCADLYDACAARFASSSIRVLYHPWHADTLDVAWYLWDRRRRSERMRVAIAGYSYGANAAISLSRHLVACGLDTIDLVGLIDPVVRWPWAPGLAAATGLGVFRVPAEVRTVLHGAQDNPRWSVSRWSQGGPLFDPAGHAVLTEPGTTRVPVALPRHVSHRKIDEAGLFADAFVARVEQMLRSPDLRAD